MQSRRWPRRKIENARAGVGRASSRGQSCACAGGIRRVKRNRDGERRALPGVLATSISPPRPQPASCRSQTQPGAAILTRRRLVGLRKGVEDRRNLVGRNADPGVLRPRLEERPVVRRPDRSCSCTDPCSVNLSALLMRLPMTWLIRTGSPVIMRGVVGSTTAARSMPLLRARSANSVIAVSACCATSTGTASSSSLPASILEKSRMSLMIASRLWPEFTITSAQSALPWRHAPPSPAVRPSP